MRIIMTIDYSPWSLYSGGAQRSTHQLAKTLANRGHNVTVIYTKPPWEKVPITEKLPYDVKWAVLPAFKSQRDAFFRPFSSISVAKMTGSLIRDEKHVIVHSNGEEGGLLHLLKKKYRFGLISEPHHPHYPQEFFNRDGIKLVRYAKLALKEGKYLMQGFAARNADYCTPPSKWAGSIIKEAFNLQEDKIFPVYNGVPDEFLRYHRDISAPKGPAVFFGRLTHTKGVDTFIDALALLKEDAPQSLIIGKGDLEIELRQKVQQLGLSDKITFKPWLSHDELGKLLSTSYMAVLPSRHENFSLGVLGAMCVGTPTISTTVGGTPEIIKNGSNGLLVAPDDKFALANAIDQLYNQDKRITEKMGQEASRYVRNNLTWQHTSEQFENIYDRVLSLQ